MKSKATNNFIQSLITRHREENVVDDPEVQEILSNDGTLDASMVRGARLVALRKWADEARDAGLIAPAAELYAEIVSRNPNDVAMLVQCAHMNKELGHFSEAERHYLAAKKLTPDDADLNLQLGHFYKISGQNEEAAAAYQRAADLDPTWAEPVKELNALKEASEKRAATSIKVRLGLGNVDKATSFLKNIPPPLFRSALQTISESKKYYLLDGIDGRVADHDLARDDLLECIELCVEAKRTDLLKSVCRALDASGNLDSVPIGLVARALHVLDDDETNKIETYVSIPTEVQNAFYSTAMSVILRQRFIIEELMSIASRNN